MRRDWVWTAAGLLAAAALFWGAGALNGRLAAERESWRPGGAEATADMPPSVAATTVLLGGFRGLAADWLWTRAGDLQDEGRYFELAQLSAWITRLQPRSPQIWAYHAWNLAYNLAAMTGDEEGKWRWVREGVRLLEEDGLRDCGGASIHRELAWIFLHKMGADDDAASPYYRRRWAEEARERATAGGGAVFGDAAAVAEIDAAVPGLDWTSPQAAAIYWAWTGLPQAKRPQEDLALRRIVYQAVFELIEAGRVDLVEPAKRLVRETAARHPENSAMRGLVERMGE
jgi:hypothetical protein